MDRATARILLSGILPDGLDVEKLTPKGRAEIREAVDLVLRETPVCRHDPCACQDAGMADPAACDFVGP